MIHARFFAVASHDYHHRHFMGGVEAIEFMTYASLVERFIGEVHDLRLLAILCLALPLLAAAVDENGVVVPDARLTITQPNAPVTELLTNEAGRARFTLTNSVPYQLQADKQGFYQILECDVDPTLPVIELTLAYQQIVHQQIDVASTSPLNLLWAAIASLQTPTSPPGRN
jgi:hypothetical protein